MKRELLESLLGVVAEMCSYHENDYHGRDDCADRGVDMLVSMYPDEFEEEES